MRFIKGAPYNYFGDNIFEVEILADDEVQEPTSGHERMMDGCRESWSEPKNVVGNGEPFSNGLAEKFDLYDTSHVNGRDDWQGHNIKREAIARTHYLERFDNVWDEIVKGDTSKVHGDYIRNQIFNEPPQPSKVDAVVEARKQELKDNIMRYTVLIERWKDELEDLK